MHLYDPTPWRGIEGNFSIISNSFKTKRHKPRGKASILIAEGEPKARTSLKALLRFSGYEITLAESGQETIELLDNCNFDLILLDLNLPGLNGYKVMEHMTQQCLDCDVIIISGEGTFNHVSLALRSSAQDFLRKPFEPEELLLTIANTLERRALTIENRNISHRLDESESLHKFLVNNSPDMIYLLDQEGYFAFINERVEGLLGYKPKEILGQHFTKLIYEEDINQAVFTFNERRTGERATQSTELRLNCKCNEESRFFKSRTVSIELHSIGIYSFDEANQKSFIGSYGVARDITKRKQAEELITYQLHHDQLTNLPNHTLFRDRLNMAMAQSRRTGKKLVVMNLDIDRFKVINDSLGHLLGDELLKMAGQRLRRELCETDTLARVGGDEFNLLIPEINDVQDARNLVDKIIHLSSQPFFINHEEIHISFSIGIALYPSDGDTQDALIKNADIAMSKVKKTGKNGYAFYSEQMKNHFTASLDIENGLRKAISTDELCLYYQPQYDMIKDKIVGVEALVRWQHPDKGIIQPDEFIDVAEESGLIIPLGEWVLHKACEDMGRWLEEALATLTLSVNISVQQLEMDQFVNRILAAIKHHRLPRNVLELEITEHVIMQDVEKAIDTLTRLSNKGVRIAIDDFGTGYSSLGYLQSLPINTLKMDRSFVEGIKPQGDNSIIDAIISMASGLKLDLIAEGVEKQLQVDQLSLAGCHLIQGYFFGRPMPEYELRDILRSQSNHQGSRK
jgi:diguanylate cyclase (GGDEF)-like protein/PAS domain S-box-containing protein